MKLSTVVLIVSAIIVSASCSQPMEKAKSSNVENVDSSTNEKEQETAKAKPEVFGCPGHNSDRHPQNHEPPIGTGKGSYFFDLFRPSSIPRGKEWVRFEYLDTVKYNRKDMNRYKILSALAKYTSMDCISVLTEKKYPDFRVLDDLDKEDRNELELKMWLGDPPGDASGQDVDFVFSCKPDRRVTDTSCFLLTKTRISPALTSKKLRSRRNTDGRDLSVIKWELNAGSTKIDSGSKEDMYYFHISFGHKDTFACDFCADYWNESSSSSR